MQNALMQKPETIRVFGAAGSASAYAIRDFLHRSLLPFEWIEVRSAGEEGAMAVAFVHKHLAQLAA